MFISKKRLEKLEKEIQKLKHESKIALTTYIEPSLQKNTGGSSSTGNTGGTGYIENINNYPQASYAVNKSLREIVLELCKHLNLNINFQQPTIKPEIIFTKKPNSNI